MDIDDKRNYIIDHAKYLSKKNKVEIVNGIISLGGCSHLMDGMNCVDIDLTELDATMLDFVYDIVSVRVERLNTYSSDGLIDDDIRIATPEEFVYRQTFR